MVIGMNMKAMLLAVSGFLVLGQPGLAEDRIPHVGDRAVLEGETTLEGAHGLVPITVTREVLTVNEAKKTAYVRVTTAIEKQSDVEEADFDFEEVLGLEEGTALESLCREEGGNIQTVAVPAGNFSGCVRKAADGAIAIQTAVGNVPFRVLKIEIRGKDEVLDLKLKEFKRAP